MNTYNGDQGSGSRSRAICAPSGENPLLGTTHYILWLTRVSVLNFKSLTRS